MKRITRSQAIADLREKLLGMVDAESSVCLVAARRGVFCRGFARWSRTELERRFAGVTRSRPGLPRASLEQAANRWQLRRQHVRRSELPCDSGARERGPSPCRGWEEFYEGELARFHRELCGEEVQVVPDELPQVPETDPSRS